MKKDGAEIILLKYPVGTKSLTGSLEPQQTLRDEPWLWLIISCYHRDLELRRIMTAKQFVDFKKIIRWLIYFVVKMRLN